MAKKASNKPKATRKPAAPGSVRRITHKVIMDGVENGGTYKVFGIAKKVFVQDTTFAKIPGLKGTFEAVTPQGKTLTSKRCFLPLELHADVAAKMKDDEAISFGAEVTVAANNPDDVSSKFFAAPAPTDPMAFLREQAGE